MRHFDGMKGPTRYLWTERRPSTKGVPRGVMRWTQFEERYYLAQIKDLIYRFQRDESPRYTKKDFECEPFPVRPRFP
jgi:hypothetical protein